MQPPTAKPPRKQLSELKIGVFSGSLFIVFVVLIIFTISFYGSNHTGLSAANTSSTHSSTSDQSAATHHDGSSQHATDQTTTSSNQPQSTPPPTPAPSANKPPQVHAAQTTTPAQPTPTAPATPTPAPPQLSIAFTCASATDYSHGQVCVHTEPSAALAITVTYCSGYDATSSSLQGTSYADANGNYTWNWEPETKCRGAATATVSANWQGQSVTNSDNFTVQ